jgi:cytochrome c biogenesis protein CcmG/thiol:disulfide interchange protein DsbE
VIALCAMIHCGIARSVRLVLCALSLAVLAACGGASVESPGSFSGSDGLVGRPAPPFHLNALAGAKGTVSLQSLRGKVVLIDFWGTFCEPCKRSFPRLQELNAKYAESGLEIVAISEDEVEDRDKVPAFAQTYGASFVVGWDEDRAIAKAYKPETMPSSYIVDKKGFVRFAHLGYHDGEEVEDEREIKDLLAK